MRYEETGGPVILVERLLYQLVSLEQDSQDLGASPPTGMQVAQEIQDLAAYAGAQRAAGHATATGHDATVAAHVDQHGRGVQTGTEHDTSGATLVGGQEAATAVATIAQDAIAQYCC